ncbi:J domain-containing protein [Aspergillus lucknowensis]|uniref:J domain-containing protein n=1 Tax=Aspergillus lucknowensis TaxID=176173 RepID=A0ABR4LDN3_9EURO
MSGDTDDAESYSVLMSYPEEADYYALLGLSRDPPATDAAIRSAYRTLTLSFHPDKQPAELQEAAQRHFARIRDAYETLIDPKKRVVYDLLGAEGVRREWGTGGSMGRGGEAETKQVGVKAMKPEEFRRWFLEAMKKRERSLVDSFVKSKGTLVLGVNASNTISIDRELGEVYVNMPDPKLSNIAVRYEFTTPFPTLRTVFGEDEKVDENGDERADDQKGAESSPEAKESPEMTIFAGVSGHFQRFVNQVELEFEDGQTEIRNVPLPLVLSTQNVNLGASVSRAFNDPSDAKGILKRWPMSLFQNSIASVNATLLPAPTIHTSLAKSVILLQGTRPYNVVFDTIFSRSIFQSLPTINLQVTKGIGNDRIAFCHWSSGFIGWPGFLQALLHPYVGLELDSALSADQEVSQFQFGVASRPTALVASADEGTPESEEDHGEDEYEILREKQREEGKTAEAWQVAVSSSPVTNGLVFKYSRNIFSGKSPTDALSKWSSEKHYSLPPENEPRSVRVEVSSTVDMNLAFSWSIHASRQVGELTRLGFGVGLRPKGLVMTVSWSRLRQTIRLPIALCPLDSVNADSAAIAVLIPWLTYCAVEFGLIRPRERRNRRKVIARRQKQLRKLIPQRRSESAQAIALMADQVRRRQEREESRGGLVITRAEYGHYPNLSKRKGDGSVREPEVADVTIPVAALIDNGQLSIPKTTAKFHILGFHDPAPLQPKVLKIWYRYHGKEHYVEVNDTDSVSCPMRLHVITD